MEVIDIVKDLPVHPTKKYSTRKLSDIKMLVVHTTDADTTPYRIAKYDITPYYIIDGKKVYNHISRSGCPAITYAEAIMKDGIVFKTLPWEQVSWHAGKWNPQALGIAMYYQVDELIPQKMMTSLYNRCADICLELKLTPDKVVGHRELKGTGWFWHKGSRRLRKTCPGMRVDLDLLRTAVCMIMQKKLGVVVDGDFGPKSKAALERWQ